MAIEKVKTNTLKHSGFKQSFTIILNETIDLIPDAAALGIYLYLARKPDDWLIWERDIMTRFGKGRDFVSKAMKLLKSLHLLKTQSNRDEKGVITGWTTTLYSQPTENPDFGVIQITENPEPGKTHILDNRTYTKERSSQSLDVIKKKDKISLGDSPNTPCENEVIQTKKSKSIGDYNRDDLFMMFYNAYPKKQKPRDAYKAYLKLKTGHLQMIDIVKDVENRLKNDDHWQEMQYIPYPATYLNARQWESDITNSMQQKKEQKEIEKQKSQANLEAQEKRSIAERDKAFQNTRDALATRKIIREVTEGQRKGIQCLKDMLV